MLHFMLTSPVTLVCNTIYLLKIQKNDNFANPKKKIKNELKKRVYFF